MVKWMKQLRKNEKGLTLIELLAVIVILGIVAAIAIPAIGSIINDSKQDAHEANALMVLNAAKLAEAAGVTAGDNWEISLKELVDNGYLSTVPKNPDNEESYNGTQSYVKKENGKYSVKLEPGPIEDISEDELNGNSD